MEVPCGHCSQTSICAEMALSQTVNKSTIDPHVSTLPLGRGARPCVTAEFYAGSGRSQTLQPTNTSLPHYNGWHKEKNSRELVPQTRHQRLPKNVHVRRRPKVRTHRRVSDGRKHAVPRTRTRGVPSARISPSQNLVFAYDAILLPGATEVDAIPDVPCAIERNKAIDERAITTAIP